MQLKDVASIKLLDRYQLVEELGRGGMGTVYRGTDELLQRPVAIKLMSAPGLGTEGRARMLREARSAASLNHPNIVAVHDAGEALLDGDNATPFVVMELVVGKNLAERPPADLEQVLDIARQLCTALDHAHNHQIVHRDLKPENVLMMEQGTAKLVDFGLARSDTTRMTVEGTIAGTLAYLPPELALGYDFDGRADLYSLGVLLYELTTGQLPFTADNPVAMITQHLHAPVVPPKAHNPEIPLALDKLIVRLLAKEPEKRPASAADVLAALENLETVQETVSVSKELTLLDRIVRGRMVGRENELVEVKSIWAKAASGQGQMLLISGEPGIGKSSLTRELITQVGVTGGVAYVGECYAERSAPYDPFAQIVRQALRNESGNRMGTEAANVLDLPGFVMADLLTLVPELRLYYQDISPNPPLDPELEQRRLFENMVAFCTALSDQRPLLIVLEDAHWADSGSLAMLHHLIRRTRKLPVLIAATFRELELDRGLPFDKLLTDLNRERLAAWVRLKRFDREQTEKMLAALFAEEITPEFLEGIYRETEGNPFFIEEVCKALVESGQLYYEDGAWQRPSMEELAIPHSVRTAIQSRVSNLPEAYQEPLRLAAILGREFDYEILSAASDLAESQLIDALEAAERAQLITSVGGTRFSFTHALIPSALVDSIHTLRRRILHRRAAAAIEALRADDVEALAYHFGEAGDDEKALGYYIQAGDQASKAFANQEAEEYFRSTLVLVEDPIQEADIRMQLGVVVARLGRNREAIQIWEPAIEIYIPHWDLEQAARLYALSARAAWEANDPKWGLEIAEMGMNALNDALESPGLTDLYHETARALFFNGERAKGTRLIQKTLAMVEGSSDLRVHVEVLITLGSFAELPLEEKIEILERAVALAAENQLLDQEARACNNLAVSCGFGAGQFARARDLTARSAELARATGSPAIEVFYSANRILYDMYLGNLQAAGKQLMELLEFSEEIDASLASETMVKTYHSVLLRLLGHHEEAIKQLRDLFALAMDVHDSNVSWIAAIYIAEIQLERNGDLDEAVAALNGTLELSYGGDAWPLSLRSMAHAQRGDLGGAKRDLARAVAVDKEESQLTDQIWLSLARANIARFEGKMGDAVAAMERAAEIADQCSMRWYRAYIHMNMAKLLLTENQEEEARELFEAARSAFEERGVTAYVDEIESHLKRMGDVVA